MDKARILYIIASSQMGGAENFIHLLMKHLDGEKFEKYIVCPEKGYYSDKFKSISKETLFINPKRSFMNIATILQVSRFIKDNKIDLIHTMLYTSDFCGIVSRHVAGRALILNTINGFNFLVLEKKSLRLKRRLASLLYRFIYRYSDKLIAVAEAVRQDLISRKGIKVNEEKLSTFLAAGMAESYNNFSREDIDYLHAKGLTDKNFLLSAVGTLNASKDYDTMLEAFSLATAKRPNIRLFIAGEGPERDRLKKKVSDLGLSGKTYFLGLLEARKKNALLYLTDIFIMSSRSEGCPTALLEAMHFGKPIIATRVGGIPEVIREDETGRLVPSREPAALAEAILDLERDRASRDRLGKRAKEDFEDRFTDRHVIKAYEDIYNKMIDEGRA